MSKSFLPTGTTVQVEGLQVATLVGCTAEERAHPQTVIVDIICTLNRHEFVDELENTFDYVPIVETVRACALAHERALIETLAEEIAAACFTNPVVEQTTVTVRKPHKLMGCAAVGTTRTFTRGAA